MLLSRKNVIIKWAPAIIGFVLEIYGLLICSASTPFLHAILHLPDIMVFVPWSSKPVSYDNPQHLPGAIVMLLGVLVHKKFGVIPYTRYDKLKKELIDLVKFRSGLLEENQKKLVAFLIGPRMTVEDKSRMPRSLKKKISLLRPLHLLFFFSAIYKGKVYGMRKVNVNKSTFEEFLREDLHIVKDPKSSHILVEKLFQNYFDSKANEGERSFIFFSPPEPEKRKTLLKKEKPKQRYGLTIFSSKILDAFKSYINTYPSTGFKEETINRKILTQSMNDLRSLAKDLALEFDIKENEVAPYG